MKLPCFVMLLLAATLCWVSLPGQPGDTNGSEWRPAPSPLVTRWGKQVRPDHVLPEYPRPQMVRDEWQNLNGVWEFSIGKQGEPVPAGKSLPRRILVPFPMESALSGIRETADFCWYRRTFTVPGQWSGKRILLHFGAVDWEATVYVNAHEVGRHRGGYDPFSLDVTDALQPGGTQELIVAVYDPMTGLTGKQSKDRFLHPRRGIFYTCVTGIWQTVWLEPVPPRFVESLQLVPDVDRGMLRVTVQTHGPAAGDQVEAAAFDSGKRVARVADKPESEFAIPIKNARLWSPDDPFLYDLKISLRRNGRTIDSVSSYFAMRKVALGKDERGITRILLNGKFTLLLGSLDQGFWPDGIYTAPSDEALRFDIEFAKRLGLNLARKHVKIEPDRWYYWCDKLGLLVWQDMPTFSIKPGYEEEAPRIIKALRNHPSIVAWIMMNEGYPSREEQELVAALARNCDPTRLVTAISGWRDMGYGDLLDRHDYPGPSSPLPEASRAAVLGEWGKTEGAVPGHDWMETVLQEKYPPWPQPNEKLDRRYEAMVGRLWRYVYTPGLSGAVWTQLTDVEGETNGFITYDREIVKNDIGRVADANHGYVPPWALPDYSINMDSEGDLYSLFTGPVEVRLMAARQDAAIHYTLDGAEPTEKSTRYLGPITLASTTTVKAAAFWPRHAPSRTAAFLYRRVDKFQPGVAARNLVPGISYQYLETDRVVQAGTLDRFTFQPSNPYVRYPKAKSWFVWRGYLRLAQDGVYTFQRPANNMALSIGSTILFTTQGGLGDREETSQIALQAGYHPIEARWLQTRDGYYSLDGPISYEGPGIPMQPIPPAALWRAAESNPPSSWHGFVSRQVALPSGDAATLVMPKSPAPGRPWVWQYALYSDGPITGQVNAPAVALLAKGWHVVVLNLGDTFGAPSALKKWDELYQVMTGSYGLSTMPILVGLSREGLAIFRWAAFHPQQVGGIYADRGVCDFKSWPGGKLGIGKGNPAEWQALIKAYGFASEAEAMAYRENPIDLAAVLAHARVPILYVAGEKDEAVPPAENALILKSRIEAAGGEMTIITVPGAGHHPHGLADPSPIIDFMLRCAQLRAGPANNQEAAAQIAGEDSAIDEKFQRWKAGLSPEQQAWESVLEAHLGTLYLPIYKRDKVEGKETAWDYVKDDPQLPRVLLIGDSISRGYTLTVRHALAGKVNVHRIPGSDGSTADGLNKLDFWLAGEKWDVVHFNFGLHDSRTPADVYERQLREIVARVQKTGAKLIWASTTPRPADAKEGPALVATDAENRKIAARVMKENGIPVDDLFAVITPYLAKVQNPKDVHFNAEGYEILGKQVAAAIEEALEMAHK